MATTRRTVRRGPQRKKIWARQLNTGASVAMGANETFNADLLSPLRSQLGFSANPLGLTILRIRGSFHIVDTSASQVGLMGIRTYHRGGVNAGVDLSEVDGPAGDPHADWMTFLAVYNQPDATFREFDVRAMRKLEEVSDSLAVSFATPDELGGQFRYTISVLVALP